MFRHFDSGVDSLDGKTERARPVAFSQSASRPAAKIKSSKQTAAASANPD
jgi:hypothetical protein